MSNESVGIPDTKVSSADSRISPTILGISFLLSSFLSSFVAAYLSVQSSVDKYIESNKEIRVLEIKTRENKDDKYDTELYLLRSELSKLHDKLLVPTPSPLPKAVVSRPQPPKGGQINVISVAPTPDARDAIIQKLRATIAATQNK